MTCGWIDIHAHLAGCEPTTLAGIGERARAAGVTAIINTATSLETSASVCRQARPAVGLYCAVGISPFDVENLPYGWENSLRQLLTFPGVVAIGETGIDGSNPRYPSMAVQMPVFEQQCALASSGRVPLVVHSRGVEKKAVDICRACGVVSAVFHCFTGDRDALRVIVDAGYHVSISGIVTFKNHPLDDVVRAVPPDRLLIETDSPYLAPVPFRGKENEPALVHLVGEAIARIQGLSPEACARRLAQNVREVFGIDAGG